MDNTYIFVTRLFNGLFESVQNETWNPTGIPTIVKLSEKISRRHKLVWVIVCKNRTESAVVHDRYKRLNMNGIDFHIIPYRQLFFSNKINDFISDMVTWRYCIRLYDRMANGLIFYFGRSNIVPAAFIKLCTNAGVVIRILGVYPDQKRLAVEFLTKLFNPMKFIAYKIRYDLAVCTQDGSGTEYFIGKLLNKATPTKIWLNGVEKTVGIAAKCNPIISILFVGKLVDDKGILELIAAARNIKRKGINFNLNIIGKGVLLEHIRDLCHDWDIAENVRLVGSVEHNRIGAYYKNADIYVSLNKMGNLSNTVIEAMAAGKCTIILAGDSKFHTDAYTGNVIPEDAVIRIDRNNIVAHLTRTLTDLLENHARIRAYSRKMVEFSKTFLWTWDERINHEVKLLEKISTSVV